MSGVWGWITGSAAAKRKDSPKNAILGLRSHLDMLQKRADHLMTQIKDEQDKAKEFVGTNTVAAKQAIRRKKKCEEQLENTNSQIMTLEAQINAIESANINMETLQAMEAAGKAMEAIHHNLTPQKVDETMDKLRDQNDLSNEVMAAITSNPLGQEIDESELDAELEELQQEKISEQMLSTGPVPTDSVHRLPKVSNRPLKKVVAVQDDEEEELRRLEAEMAI